MDGRDVIHKLYETARTEPETLCLALYGALGGIATYYIRPIFGECISYVTGLLEPLNDSEQEHSETPMYTDE